MKLLKFTKNHKCTGAEIKRIVLTSSDELVLKQVKFLMVYFIQVRNGDNSMFVKKLMIR